MILNLISVVLYSDQVDELKDQITLGNEKITILTAEKEAALEKIEQIKNDLTITVLNLDQEKVSSKSSIIEV